MFLFFFSHLLLQTFTVFSLPLAQPSTSLAFTHYPANPAHNSLLKIHAISLQNLVLGRDDANRHTITDPIDLHPGDYFVLERNEAATSASSSYIYGSDILLPNTGALLFISNEGTESNPRS